MMLPLALAVAGAAPQVAVAAPPVLVMVQTEGPPSFMATQARFRDELALLLDRFMVMSTPVDAPGFARLPLAEQLAAVLPITAANEAVAAVWLAQPMRGQLMLHLVAMGTGRTLVRTIELDRRSRSEAALALMLRELLGTAFLFEPQVVEPEVKRVVEEVRREALAPAPTPAPAAAPPPPPPRPWALSLSGVVEAGLVEVHGPATRYGGSAGLTRSVGPLRVGVEVGGAFQEGQVSPGVAVTASSLQLLATAGLRFEVAGLSLGPRLGLGTELSWVASAATDPQRLRGLGVAGLAGFEASAGRGPIAVQLRVELWARQFRAEIVDDAYAPPFTWALPVVSVRAAFGVSWEGL